MEIIIVEEKKFEIDDSVQEILFGRKVKDPQKEVEKLKLTPLQINVAKFSAAIAKKRIEKGRSRYWLAEKTDLTYDTLRKIESGVPPNMKSVMKVCEALDCDLVIIDK